MTQHIEPLEDVLEIIEENKRLTKEVERLTGHVALCIEGMKDKNKRIMELEAMLDESSRANQSNVLARKSGS